MLVQQGKTFSGIVTGTSACCVKVAIRIVLLLAFVSFTAAGADARQIPPVPSKAPLKKPAPASKTKLKKTVKLKSAELPALPPRTINVNKKPGAGSSLTGAGADGQLRSELERYLGTRYKRGGTGGDGFDCSGFSRSMYRKLFGVDLPHNAQSQFQLPMFAKLNENTLKTGDLVFFSPTSTKKSINHVGIYLDDGQFIHAQSKSGIVISSIEDDHWRNRLVSAKRLDNKAGLKPGAFDGLSDSNDEPEEDDAAESGMHVRYSSKEKRSFIADRVAMKSSPGKKPQSIELDYVQPIFGKSCNLQLGSFREDFDLYDDNLEAPFSVNDPYGAYSIYSYTQGIRIAGDIKPFQWMSITPSFMYYNHGPELNAFEMPTRSIGVDVSLGSLADAGWSLSTGLKYASLSSAALRSTSRSYAPSLLDMSFTYSQRLNDRMQLSLMGQRLRSSVPDMSADLRSGLRADQRVFFMLNYNY